MKGSNILEKNIDWDFPTSSSRKSVHSIHPYPAKFIPEIPRKLLKIYSPPKGTLIFDPFCGSGTTLVEAKKQGYDSIGVDLNPIACLISSVKTRKVSFDVDQLLEEIDTQLGTDKVAIIPSIPNLDHWFKKPVQHEIQSLLNTIDNLYEGEINETLRLALSSILVRVSNQESDTRYAAIDKDFKEGDVRKKFEISLRKILKYVAEDNSPNVVTVLNKSILGTTIDDIPGKVGLMITSPPYPNAYEYWLYHKYRMFWLGFNPQEVKNKEIGARAHYYKKNAPTTLDFKNQMKHVLELTYNKLIRNGRSVVVVGRSKIHGEIIDNSEIIQKVGSELGYEIESVIPRVIKRSSKAFNLNHANIIKEHIIILRK